MSETDNPYLPPKAAVADVSGEAPRARPVAVTVALCLIGTRLLLGLGVMVQPMLITSLPLPVSIYVMMALSLGVIVALVYFIALGQNWARIVYLIITLIALAGFLFVLITMLRAPPGVAILGDVSLRWVVTVLLPQLLSIVAVVLLFGPGRAWFRPRD